MTETSPTPDSVASPTTWSDMNADQLSSALRDNKISGFQRGDALTRYANLLKGETAGAAPERINMQSIPTAADDPRPDTATAAVSGAGDPYAPARTPADYQIPISRDPSAEESSGDIAMRQALHAAELPAVTANAIAQVFDFNARQFADAEPAQLDAFGKNEGRALQQLWGDGFAAKVQAVDALLDSAADRIPLVRTLIEHPQSRFFFSDRRVVSALSQMIENRTNTKGERR